jgi:hypothetical protein
MNLSRQALALVDQRCKESAVGKSLRPSRSSDEPVLTLERRPLALGRGADYVAGTQTHHRCGLGAALADTGAVTSFPFAL